MHSLLEPKIRIIYWLTVNTIFGHYEKKARLRNKMIETKWLEQNGWEKMNSVSKKKKLKLSLYDSCFSPIYSAF